MKASASVEHAASAANRVIDPERVRVAREQQLAPRVVEDLSRVFKALADPSRIRIALALAAGEMCVRDIAVFLSITESAVSHQLRKLRDLRLVRTRRQGQVLFYALDDDHVQGLLAQALDHVRDDRLGK